MSNLIIVEILVVLSIVCIAFSIFRCKLAEFFTTETEVIEIVSSLSALILPVYLFVSLLSQFWNGLFVVLKQAKTSQNLTIALGMLNFSLLWLFSFYFDW